MFSLRTPGEALIVALYLSSPALLVLLLGNIFWISGVFMSMG